jgi:hypothetical protein
MQMPPIPPIEVIPGEKCATPVGWFVEEKQGGSTSRVCAFEAGRITKWEQITNANPPKDGEEIYVETLPGILKMTVHLEAGGVYVDSESYLGSLHLYEDGEWRCPGVGNKRSIQRLKLFGGKGPPP